MPPKEPQRRCTHRYWNPTHLAHASKLSMDAWHRSNIPSLPQFIQQHGIRNLFLASPFMNNEELQSETSYICVLLESASVGTSWGASDMLLDMSIVNQKETRIEYLQAAAGFSGAVYLIGIELSQEEASEWWDTLRHSHTPPHSLFFLYRLLSPTHLNDIGSYATAAQMLLETITDNKLIKEVTVFSSDIVFGSSTIIDPHFTLDSFHLEKVSLSDEFLKALSNLDSKSITKALTLSSHTGSTWHPWFHRFLLWQLQELSLLGYNLEISDVIDFLKHLQECNDTSLHRLSLGDANDHAHEMSTALVVVGESKEADSSEVLVAAVVDALQVSGLPFFSLQGLRLRDPAIEAQLLQNQRKHSSVLKLHKKVPTMALRLFICGDAYAGKTTLLLSLGAACSKRRRVLHKVKGYMTRTALERTRGIEVYEIEKDNIRMSLWDMAGQREFHAFHDYMFPDPSSNHSSPAMFMFVWSPVISKNEGDGEHKFEDAFEDSFRYWLKFIASKTRQSNVTRKIIVVITRKDQMDLVAAAIKPSIDALKAKFNKIVEIVAVLEVDARSTCSVKPVASCIFQTAKHVLHGAETYDICRKVSRCLSSWFPQRNAFKDQPVIKWDAFEKFCREKFQIKDKHVQRAIASSLNESGDLIYLNNMLVLDPNWFCHEIMGNLIYFPDSCSSRIIHPRGYANLQYLESILQNHAQTAIVQACHLVELMEAMHLCCKIPNDPGQVFIAATLSTTEAVEPLKWRGGDNKDAQKFAYLGRRLECDRKDLTFLTPALFPMLQVLFNKALGGIEADVKLQRDVMSICIRGMEIIVESGVAKGEHVIDVMVRAPDWADVGNTLMYVEDNIIQTLIRICAQPVGNQGVKLVEGVIRPDCLYEPARLEVREDQCVLIRDLKLKLRRQIEAGEQQQKLLYQWKENRHLKPVASPFVDLLGIKEFKEVLLSYKASLKCVNKEVTQMINLGYIQNIERPHEYLRSSHMSTCVHRVREDAASTSTQAGYGMQENITLEMGETSEEESSLPHQSSDQIHADLNDNIADETAQQIVLRLMKTMVSLINGELQNINTNLQNINTKVDGLRSSNEDILKKLNAMHQDIYEIRNDVLPKVQKIVEQSLYFAVEKEQGKVPRLGYLTTEKVGMRRKMVTAIFKDLKSVQIELFCEHREHPHKVEGQKGICVTTIDEGMLKKALPWLNGLLKLLTLVARVGAHVIAGLGNVLHGVPDLASIISLGLDTPGFLDSHGLREAASSTEALAGWQQCLVSVLEKHGGMRESNIYDKFKLRRALYQDTHHVAWLCPQHYPPICIAKTASSLNESCNPQLVIPFPLIT